MNFRLIVFLNKPRRVTKSYNFQEWFRRNDYTSQMKSVLWWTAPEKRAMTALKLYQWKFSYASIEHLLETMQANAGFCRLNFDQTVQDISPTHRIAIGTKGKLVADFGVLFRGVVVCDPESRGEESARYQRIHAQRIDKWKTLFIFLDGCCAFKHNP